MLLRYWIFLFSGIVLLAAPLDLTVAQDPLDPRVGVRLEFSIEGTLIKQRLRDDLEQVANAMEKSLRHSLASYGFLNWDAPANQVSHTIEIRLKEADSRPKHIYLMVSVRGPGVIRTKPEPLLFEPFLSRSSWKPHIVAQEWSQNIQNVVEANQTKLVSNVFGLTPLKAKVKLYPQDYRANVVLHPGVIRASRYPTPKFRLHTSIKDYGPQFVTEGIAELALGGCTYETQSGTYVCDIEGIAYKGKSMLPAGHYHEMMQRAEIKVLSLHVREYWPDDSQENRSVLAQISNQ